ncbi:MAG TPA: nitroreductase [Lysobacter sp.]|nr:nitroreductase [Lysobacter sp.]
MKTFPSTDALNPLDSRRSVPARMLGEPGPDDATLLRLLASATRVPDHGKRVPFRCIRIHGDSRHAFGERLTQRLLERDPNASDALLAKERERFARAPLVLAVIGILGPDEKIPAQERLLSAGCVCFALLQAAQALGFGASWVTGWPAYDDEVKRWLGLGEHDVVVGFVHIGTPTIEPPERERPDPRALLTDWSPA